MRDGKLIWSDISYIFFSNKRAIKRMAIFLVLKRENKHSIDLLEQIG